MTSTGAASSQRAAMVRRSSAPIASRSPGCAASTPPSSTNRMRAAFGATALGAAFSTSGFDGANTSRLK